MANFKKIWKRTSVKVAYIVSAVVIVLLITLSIVATQNQFLYETLKMALGSEVLVSENAGYYISDYAGENDPKASAKAAGLRLNEKIGNEGMVLLKNDRNSLPLSRGAEVTVFGKNSVNFVIGGSGSSGSSASDASTVYTSLVRAGFTYNQTMKSFYEDSSRSGSGRGTNPSMSAATVPGFSTGETALPYPDNVRSSYTGNTNNTALVVISRIGGEGFDLPRTMKTAWDSNTPVSGAGSASDHYLELDANEKAMIQEACNNFNNVVLILNTSSMMELGFLDRPVFHDDATNQNYDFSNLRSALFVGLTGENGIDSLGSILNGDVTPSGHLADIYGRDFTADPTWQNFGNNLIENGNRHTVNGNLQNAYFVNYEEGIYIGYRYYETRGYTDGENWYDDNVVYPFGYGLSYTEFDWQVTAATANGATLTADGTLSFDISVENIGNYDGKDVVQLYYSAPYLGGIEKSHVELGGFAKTKLLTKKGNGDDSKDTVTIEIDVRDMASYDYSDANTNSFKGYELEAGTYTIYIAKDAHGWANDCVSFTYTVPTGGFRYANDDVTDTAIENRFDDVSGHINTYLSRNNWTGTFPTMPTDADRGVSQSFITSLRYVYGDAVTDPWYTDIKPTQAASELADDEVTVHFIDLVVGRNDGDLTVDYDDKELWDSLLNQLTVDQMARFVGVGNYQTSAILNIQKPKSIDPDGPGGYTIFAELTAPSVFGTATYCGEMLLACTWNVELAYEMGVCIGNEGVIGNTRDGTPYSGWYAPACNIHRSPFGGRNWEYYSEDGFLSGEFTANVVKGAKTKGVYCYVKHFALNEQEANRDSNGLITWASEQSMREIYLKPFEMAVKDGKTTAMMSSFNRLGTVWAGGSYALLTQVLRQEWGFKGTVVTDYGVNKAYMSTDQMLRAGGDLKLNQSGYPDNFESATDVSVIRQATKNILYTTASSCLINVAFDMRYNNPVWVNVLIIVDCVVSALLVAWCVVMTVLAIKREKNQQA